jgi:hypothetical protein
MEVNKALDFHENSMANGLRRGKGFVVSWKIVENIRLGEAMGRWVIDEVVDWDQERPERVEKQWDGRQGRPGWSGWGKDRG